jgi:hypothetical protein
MMLPFSQISRPSQNPMRKRREKVPEVCRKRTKRPEYVNGGSSGLQAAEFPNPEIEGFSPGLIRAVTNTSLATPEIQFLDPPPLNPKLTFPIRV